MLSQLFLRTQDSSSDLLASSLLNENTSYKTFIKDLGRCQSEVIIGSPFITNRRLCELLSTLLKLRERSVRIVIVTKDPREHDKDYLHEDAAGALAKLQKIGVHVIFVDGHYRKLAILDRKVLYEGSLNILSQNNSREIMRRIESVRLAWEMAGFIGFDRSIG